MIDHSCSSSCYEYHIK